MKKKKYNCPAEMTLDLIGGKWKIILIWHLRKSPKRFGELKRTTPGISQTMLSQQLRSLEERALIRRKIICERPFQVEYSLTDLGISLKPILYTLVKWGRENQNRYVVGEYGMA